MKFPWFRSAGLLFFPVSIPGWTVLLLAAVCSVYSFIEIDSKSHSVSDTLMNFALRIIIIFAGYTFIAFLASRTKSK
jgi:hypothetical protein